MVCCYDNFEMISNQKHANLLAINFSAVCGQNREVSTKLLVSEDAQLEYLHYDLHS